MREIDERMFEAAGRGDMAGIERAVAGGADMRARDTDGRTTAMLAAQYGRLTPELAECLSRLGCPMDARDKDGATVAMRAIRYGRLTTEMAETFARLGCPMDARDNYGRTVAMRAAWNGHLTPELAETLARLGCPMDARDKDGWAVATHAAWEGILTPELAETLARLGCPMNDVRIGKEAAEDDMFASFAVWAKYTPDMALRAFDSFSNAKKRAAGALALLSSGVAFDEGTVRALAATFSKSRTGAVEHLLGDEEIFRAIDGAHFLELASSGRALKAMDAAAARNLLSMCRSMLDERPEKLGVVKTALSKTFAGTLDACADDPEAAELLVEVAGRMAALDDAEARRFDGDAFDEPCL